MTLGRCHHWVASLSHALLACVMCHALWTRKPSGGPGFHRQLAFRNLYLCWMKAARKDVSALALDIASLN